MERVIEQQLLHAGKVVEAQLDSEIQRLDQLTNNEDDLEALRERRLQAIKSENLKKQVSFLKHSVLWLIEAYSLIDYFVASIFCWFIKTVGSLKGIYFFASHCIYKWLKYFSPKFNQLNGLKRTSIHIDVAFWYHSYRLFESPFDRCFNWIDRSISYSIDHLIDWLIECISARNGVRTATECIRSWRMSGNFSRPQRKATKLCATFSAPPRNAAKSSTSTWKSWPASTSRPVSSASTWNAARFSRNDSASSCSPPSPWSWTTKWATTLSDSTISAAATTSPRPWWNGASPMEKPSSTPGISAPHRICRKLQRVFWDSVNRRKICARRRTNRMNLSLTDFFFMDNSPSAPDLFILCIHWIFLLETVCFYSFSIP